ncbi:MAG: NAD-binding protein [Halobacteria archaeon]|nr:NAD-binding protein [Halobacteria archaeon]
MKVVVLGVPERLRKFDLGESEENGNGDRDVEESEEVEVEVVEAEGVGEDALIEAGIDDADVFVVYGGERSVQVTVAKHVNPDLKAVLIADDAPDYVRANADLILREEIVEEHGIPLSSESETS